MFKQSSNSLSTKSSLVSPTGSAGTAKLVGTKGGNAEAVIRQDPRLSQYPYTLNFYMIPPIEEINLTEFEIYALDRIRVLRAIETAKLRFKKQEDIERYLTPIVSKYLELTSNNRAAMYGTELLYDQRRKDHLSHFIVRLAFCRTDDLRQWFVRQEMALFKYRYEMEQLDDRTAFLRDTQMDFVQYSFEDLLKEKLVSLGHKKQPAREIIEEERESLVSDIKSVYGYSIGKDIDITQVKALKFYRVPFEKVLDLVSRRAAILLNGWAFVPESERAVLMFNAFRDHLVDELEKTARALPRMDEDDRLIPVLNSLSKQYLGKEYTSQGTARGPNGSISHDDVDGLVSHFPPCMRHLHQTLRRDMHLKHSGRLQYGLFLKGIGLSLEEALVFWRKSFARMSDDEFKKKNYVYNIRYNYGQEGKRANYTPYSCMRIITGTHPSTGDAHGCPFKHFSADHLADTLRSLRVSEQGVQEIGARAREGHYQLACTRLYELTKKSLHGLEGGSQNDSVSQQPGTTMQSSTGEEVLLEIIEHPNQWFDMSYRGISQKPVASSQDASMEYDLNR